MLLHLCVIFDFLQRNLTIIEEGYLKNIQLMYNDLIPYAEQNITDAITDMAELATFNQSIQAFFDDIFLYIDTAPPFTLFFKTLLCKSPYGISPFFKKSPGEACKLIFALHFDSSYLFLVRVWMA